MLAQATAPGRHRARDRAECEQTGIIHDRHARSQRGRSPPLQWAAVRVALDVTATITGSTGVARYARELERSLAEHGVETAMYAVGRAQHPVPPGVRHLRVPLRLVQRSQSIIGWPRP